jgi:hypothetical protein
MNAPFIESAVTAVVATYGSDHVRRAAEGERTLVRVDAIEMPPGCKPETSPMMLLFDPAQPKPLPYFQPGQLLANGKVPTSTSPVMAGGEPWMQFSFNIPWEERDGIVRFIAAARQRFAQDA